MKTNDELRRENLLVAITRAGSAAKLAEAAGTSPAYLSQIKNRTPDSKTGVPKMMGDDMARRIEVAIAVAPGWMDQDHSSGAADSMDVPHHGSRINLSDTMNMTCETASEFQLLQIYRLANEDERGAIDIVVERVRQRLSAGERHHG